MEVKAIVEIILALVGITYLIIPINPITFFVYYLLIPRFRRWVNNPYNDFMVNRKEIRPEESFTLTMDLRKSIPGLVSEGKYDWWNRNVMDGLRPTKREKEQRVGKAELVLLNFGRNITPEEVLIEFARRKLSAANPRELLNFGAIYPQEQNISPIVAMDTKVTWDGEHALCLFSNKELQRQVVFKGPTRFFNKKLPPCYPDFFRFAGVRWSESAITA